MDDVIKLYWTLRSNAEKNGDELAQLYGVGDHEDPASFFGMAFNSITMTLELLDHYHNLWGKLNPKDFPNVAETREQNGQRVNLLQKICFIELMSAFEFSAKKAVLQNEDVFEKFNGRIYLTGIMKRSHEKGLIDEAQLNLWKGASILRNSLVHNNGIAEDNKEFDYPDVTVTLRNGEMTQGNLKLFALVSKWLLQEARVWLENANKQIQPTQKARG
ncbi:hypothetical protein [Salinivibrio sp. VYel4]|uniref:hypothetical protein n=1 Tax=Salinivibrio sp. VYel4 TaxID=2490491 RepID=UPI00128D18F8|nr:hypothetical protein [Salinivibrio sp. VYel4]MPY01368.1 hypothetical protein [Salinivibrio sp. VYel4]